MDRYPAKFTDARGCEVTTITNDGETLRIALRGLEFIGRDFDSLSPREGAAADQLQPFTLHHNCLCSCRIECRIPIPIHARGEQRACELLVDLSLGDPAPNGGLDCEELRLTLEYDNQRFCGSGKSGWFEDE